MPIPISPFPIALGTILRTCNIPPSYQVGSVMEYRPNYNPESSGAIWSEALNAMLTEHYITHWFLCDCPNHTYYATYTARLRSYVNWPHIMKPVCVNAAGFSIPVGPTYIFCNVKPIAVLSLSLIIHLITGHNDRTVCFHCAGGCRTG